MKNICGALSYSGPESISGGAVMRNDSNSCVETERSRPPPLQGRYTEKVILVVDEAVSLTLKTGVL